jgi:predicted MPP superfamily phosphohydrolase
MVSARGEHEIVTVEVPLPRLPRGLDGFTIVQLTDLHVGVTIDHEFVRRVVERANALKPDLIALTGDLVDGTVANLRADAAPLADLRAPHGVFAVTGNHEYYSGADEWIAELSRHGIRYLRNQRVAIGRAGASDGDGGPDGFDLAGIDDHSAHRWRGHGADLDAALAGRDPSRALVLLAHQPRQVRVACERDVDLQLSGHTHGGQVWPWHYIVKVQQGGLLAGLYREKQTALYVSRGCGYFGPPVRVGAPLEITRVVLRAVA